MISAASLVANGVVPVVTRSMAWRERRRRALKAFPNLSREEKEILVRFEGQRTQQIRAGKGTEVELERLGFVRRIGPGPHTDVEVYAIEDWAWEHMKKQGEFVKLAEELKG